MTVTRARGRLASPIVHAYYRDLEIYRSDLIIPFGFLSMLIQGTVFAFVYPRWMAKPDALWSGLRFAAGAALLSWMLRRTQSPLLALSSRP